MKDQWRRLAARFDALALRERVLVFAVVIVGGILLFEAFALEPLAVRKKRLASQLAEARLNIKIAEGVIAVQETRPDPDAVKRSYGDALRKQLAEIDQSIQGLHKGLVPPERMAKLLEEMLSRGRGLTLVSLRTLPVQRFENPAALAAPKPAGTGAKAAQKEPDRGIYQHSFEISFQGSYTDLHEYLARLEHLPSQMFWGRINLDTELHPRLKVTLTVHTLSLSRAWLVV